MAIVLKKDKMSEIERDIVKRQASCISNTSTSIEFEIYCYKYKYT